MIPHRFYFLPNWWSQTLLLGRVLPCGAHSVKSFRVDNSVADKMIYYTCILHVYCRNFLPISFNLLFNYLLRYCGERGTGIKFWPEVINWDQFFWLLVYLLLWPMFISFSFHSRLLVGTSLLTGRCNVLIKFFWPLKKEVRKWLASDTALLGSRIIRLNSSTLYFKSTVKFRL